MSYNADDTKRTVLDMFTATTEQWAAMTFTDKKGADVPKEEAERRLDFLRKWAYHTKVADSYEFKHWGIIFYVKVSIPKAKAFYSHSIGDGKKYCWSAGMNGAKQSTTVPVDRSRVTTEEAYHLASRGYTVFEACSNESYYPSKADVPGSKWELGKNSAVAIEDFVYVRAAMADLLHFHCNVWMTGAPPRMLAINDGVLMRCRDRATARVATGSLEAELKILFNIYYGPK
jgi:hypothetical protein